MNKKNVDVTKTEMPKKLTAAKKVEYKKSLAKMMVFWMITTHPKWKERLLTRQFDFWKADLPQLAGAFSNVKEWEDFLDRARLVAMENQGALDSFNTAASNDWVEILTGDPDCPADEALELLFVGFAERVKVIPEK